MKDLYLKSNTLWQASKKYLDQPYPWKGIGVEIQLIASIAFIVFFILFALQPFELEEHGDQRLLYSLAFGTVTFVLGTVFYALIQFRVKSPIFNKVLKLKNFYLVLLFYFFVIGTANLITDSYLSQTSIDLYNLLRFLSYTFMLGPILILLWVLLIHIRLNNVQQLNITQQLEDLKKPKAIKANSAQILAVKALQNYVQVYRLDNGALTKEIMRKTLSGTQQELSHHNLIRCHRSYLVNPNFIRESTGNSGGLMLTLNHQDCPQIPVSRTHLSTLREVIAKQELRPNFA